MSATTTTAAGNPSLTVCTTSAAVATNVATSARTSPRWTVCDAPYAFTASANTITFTTITSAAFAAATLTAYAGLSSALCAAASTAACPTRSSVASRWVSQVG